MTDLKKGADALYTMDQMREYADNFHLSRMRVLVAEKEAYERHAPTVTPAMVKAAMPWLANLQNMRKTDKESNVEEAIRAALAAAKEAS